MLGLVRRFWQAADGVDVQHFYLGRDIAIPDRLFLGQCSTKIFFVVVAEDGDDRCVLRQILERLQCCQEIAARRNAYGKAQAAR